MKHRQTVPDSKSPSKLFIKHNLIQDLSLPISCHGREINIGLETVQRPEGGRVFVFMSNSECGCVVYERETVGVLYMRERQWVY